MFIWTGGDTLNAKEDKKESRDVVIGVVTPIDLLNYITDTEEKENHLEYKNSLKLKSELKENCSAKFL